MPRQSQPNTIFHPLPVIGGGFYITPDTDVMLNAISSCQTSFFFTQINNDTVFTDCYKNDTKHKILWYRVFLSQ